MEPNELSDELEKQVREREAESGLDKPTEGGDMELTLDDLDGAAGGRLWVAEARILD